MLFVYSHTITPRLKYIFDFISKEILPQPTELTDNVDRFNDYTGPKINYSDKNKGNNQLWLKPHPLLFEKGIRKQQVDCFVSNQNKAIFKTEGDFEFDLFAASFYLLSRYEEYLPHEKDMYGRYAYQNSIAFRENFLQVPLINLWIDKFKKVLQRKFADLSFDQPRGSKVFQFIPTYDIDIAYSYKLKGLVRSIAGTVNTFINGGFSQLKERFRVISGKSTDPYDSYSWLTDLNYKKNLKPIYFFNVAHRLSRYDKNISPLKKEMRSLILQHSNQYEVGVHPSWQSGDNFQMIKKEIETLENITGKKISFSRQHYIRFILPETFRQLIQAGIHSDYSMGYGSINGFRASVASPFYWYDLQKEEPTNLQLHPFCFMEANSFFEQKFTARQALEELRNYTSIIKSVNGLLITIWHNTFLGTDPLFAGWREVYQEWIEEVMN